MIDKKIQDVLTPTHTIRILQDMLNELIAINPENTKETIIRNKANFRTILPHEWDEILKNVNYK